MLRILLVLIVLSAWACGPLERHGDPAMDAHEHETVTHTLFTDKLEFFLEHPPLIVGQTARFLVHCTRLMDYSPVASGTLSLSVNGQTVKTDHLHQAGIFEFEIIPQKAGHGHLDLHLQAEGLDEKVHFHAHIAADHDELHAGDHSPGSEDAHEDSGDQHAGHSHGSKPAGDITYLKEEAWKSDFMVSQVAYGPFVHVTHSSGEIMPAPGKINRQTAPARGMIDFADPGLVQGAHVKAGKHLFTIRSSSLPGENMALKLQQAANSLAKSRADYQRHTHLLAEGAVSRKTYQASQAAYRADSLLFSDLDRNTGAEGVKIYAENSGSIHLLNVSQGAFVETGQPLLTISRDKMLLLRADLPQQYFHLAAEIRSASFRMAYAEEPWTLEEFHGRHLATGHSVAENEHYLPVYFELENDGRLMEGAFAEVYLKGPAVDSCLLIPNAALIEEQGANYVYVQTGGESYEKRAVETGGSDGLHTEIRAGLSAGERFVSRGSILVKAASMVTAAVGHGHAH